MSEAFVQEESLFGDGDDWVYQPVSVVAPAIDPDPVVEEEKYAWRGVERLRSYVVPISDLVVTDSVGDGESVTAGLREYGQVRPVLLAEDRRTVVGRGHLIAAALELGWTHVAARLETAELSLESLDQVSLIDIAEEAGVSVDGFARVEEPEVAEDVDVVNAATADPSAEWVGLPVFVPASEALKVVVSCETEEERDALFDALGIQTIHKGTRGTLSVWWPDRAKEDLSSLRFEEIA
jgi:hypothetical protein